MSVLSLNSTSPPTWASVGTSLVPRSSPCVSTRNRGTTIAWSRHVARYVRSCIYCVHPITVPPHSYFSSTPPSRAFTKFWRSSTQSSTSSSSSTLSTWEPTRQVPDHHPAKSCVQCSFIQVHFGCWNSTTKVTNYMKAQGWETDEEGESKSKLFPHNSLVLHRFLSFLGRFHFSVARVPRALECQIEKSPWGEGRGGKPVGNHHLDFAHHSAKVFGQYSAQRLHDSDLDQWLGKKDHLGLKV